MRCSSCRNYRPNSSLYGRCRLHSSRMRHDQLCSSYETAPVESLAEFIERGGVIERRPPGPDLRHWRSCVVRSHQSKRAEKHGMVPIDVREVIR